MSARDDIARVERIIREAEAGTLSDVTVFAILASVRAEATLEERERQAARLQRIGYRHLVRGERQVAEALESAASALEIPPPPTPQ